MTSLNSTTNNIPAFLQKSTLVKAKIWGICNFLKRKKSKIKKERVFYYKSIYRAIRYEILRSSNLQILKNDLIKKERCV